MTVRPYAEEPARRPLIALATCASVATVSGTLIYAYPETLRAVRGPLVVAHDVSGDLMLIAAVVYLWVHLRRTWPMKKWRVSRWTGIVTVAILCVVGASGIYGQLAPMPSGSALSLAHVIAAVALVALACFHGAHGLRRRLR